MKFLIPKTIKFVKLQIWRSVGLIDLLIILMVVGFASIIILLLQIDIIFKILAVILVGCATIPLTFYWQPRKKDEKLFYYDLNFIVKIVIINLKKIHKY